MQPDTIFSIDEAARFSCVTRQSVYVAVKKGRIKAHKSAASFRWQIYKSDLDEYIRSKYCRSYGKASDGSVFYSVEEGRYSPSQAAEIVDCPVQNIYYQIRTGGIKITYKDHRMVIRKEHLDEYINWAEPCEIIKIKQRISKMSSTQTKN